MANKARTRKWQENKDTVFSFGEKLWDSDRIENTLHRAKRGRIEAPVGMC